VLDGPATAESGGTVSLKSFIKLREIVELVAPLRPTGPRKISAPMRVKPGSKRYSLVGTAFDYLLRFDLQRRVPNAIARRWVADDALFEMTMDAPSYSALRTVQDEDPAQTFLRAEDVVRSARSALDAFMRSPVPTYAETADLAAHAIRLAKLDSFYRSDCLDPNFAEAKSEDVDDLLQMLEIVPYSTFLHNRQPLLLNPDFGVASNLVEGADADLICGDTLIDIKVTGSNEIKNDYRDQLLGYFLLSRYQRRMTNVGPEIEYVGIYFARHGYLWIVPVSEWTAHKEFARTENAFFEFAKHQQAEKQAQHEAEDVEFNKRLSEEKRRDRRRAAVTTKPYVVRVPETTRPGLNN
jgi:hypothetical protein